MKIAILTVLYPDAKKFFKKFLNSVSKQTYKNFTLVIVNENTNLNIPKKKFQIDVIKGFKKDGQKNRINGMRYCKKKFDFVICADVDDTIHKDRIKKVLNFFKRNKKKEIVFSNAINRKYRFKSFKKKTIVLNDILNFNLLGFGCLSFKSSLLDKVQLIKNKNIEIFDWWLFSIFLFKIKKIDVLKDSIVNYNYHSNNSIGPNNSTFDYKEINKCFNHKINHYREMKNYCNKQNLDKGYSIYKKLLLDYQKTFNFYLENPLKYNKYMKNFLKSKRNTYWFEHIIIIKN